jgi:hypothetical protein
MRTKIGNPLGFTLLLVLIILKPMLIKSKGVFISFSLTFGGNDKIVTFAF